MEFRKVKLKEIADVQMGQSPKSIYYNQNAEGLPFLQGVRTFGEIYPTIDTYTTKYNKIANKGDILFTVRAPVGDINIAPTKLCIGRGLASISSDNQDFLFYLLKNNKKMYNNFSTGTIYNSINKTELENLEFCIPDDESCIKIASILKNYDKKIEINNKIIANLEAQAQALFKYYFIDFEPFADGNFVDSDLGPIPEGWEVVELSDVADFRNGYSFKSKELDDTETHDIQYKVFKMGDINVGGGINLGKTKSWVSKEFVEEKNISRYILDYGDLLMCMTDMKDNVRLLGHVAYNWFEDEYILNQRVGRIISKSKEITNEYLYFLINSDKFIEELRSRANRGVQVNLSTKEIKASKVLVPNTPYLDKYNKFISNIMKYIGYLTKQNQTLAQARDALLPRLMAGEIDLEGLGGSYD